jgi:hypothetical protein
VAEEKVTVAVDLPTEPLPMATVSAGKVSNWFAKSTYGARGQRATARPGKTSG